MPKILVIDDKKDNLVSLKAVINNHRPTYEVITALSGVEGIEIATRDKPDTILLDIIMPVMDGYEVCKQLKSNIVTKHIPVVMITAIKTDSESRIKGLEIGADAFLSKPIDPAELTAQINVMLRIKEAEDKLRVDKESLEQKVNERTKDLIEANSKLTKSKKTIQKSEERMSTMFEEAPLGIALIDSLTGHIYEVNLRFSKIVGRTVEEMTTIDWMSITHPEDVQEDFDNMALLNAGKITGFNMNKRYIKPDGSYVWINMTIAPMKVEDKTKPRHLCMIDDITERKRIEEELEKHREHLEELVKERTVELEDKNKELERYNRLFEDREFRIKELRDKVKELEEKNN